MHTENNHTLLYMAYRHDYSESDLLLQESELTCQLCWPSQLSRHASQPVGNRPFSTYKWFCHTTETCRWQQYRAGKVIANHHLIALNWTPYTRGNFHDQAKLQTQLTKSMSVPASRVLIMQMETCSSKSAKENAQNLILERACLWQGSQQRHTPNGFQCMANDN